MRISDFRLGDDFLTYKGAVDKHGQKIYAVRGLSSLNKKTICGFEIVNLYDKPIRLKVVAVVKPLDYTYSICFRNEITSNNGGIN